MVCPACTATNEPDSQFCAQCGTALAAAAPVQYSQPVPTPGYAQPGWVAPRPKRSRWWWWVGGGVAAVLLLLILAALFSPGPPVPDPDRPVRQTQTASQNPPKQPEPQGQPQGSGNGQGQGGATAEPAGPGPRVDDLNQLSFTLATSGSLGAGYLAWDPFQVGDETGLVTADGQQIRIIGWNGDAVTVLAAFPGQGELLDVNAGDLVNEGKDAVAVLFEDRLWAWSPGEQPSESPGEGVRRSVPGDYDGDGRTELLALVHDPATGESTLRLGRITDEQSETLAVLPAPEPGWYYQRGIKAGGRSTVSIYTEDGTLRHYWVDAQQGLQEQAALELPTQDMLNCWYEGEIAGQQVVAASYETADGLDYALLWQYVDPHGFTPGPRLELPAEPGRSYCAVPGNFNDYNQILFLDWTEGSYNLWTGATP